MISQPMRVRILAMPWPENHRDAASTPQFFQNTWIMMIFLKVDS
jgi:hypothetical protein